jgi:hypothetical protein
MTALVECEKPFWLGEHLANIVTLLEHDSLVELGTSESRTLPLMPQKLSPSEFSMSCADGSAAH